MLFKASSLPAIALLTGWVVVCDELIVCVGYGRFSLCSFCVLLHGLCVPIKDWMLCN